MTPEVKNRIAQIRRGKVPEGYKRTKKRLQPDDWFEINLEDAVSFLDGRRIPIKENERVHGEYPYYGASGIIDYVNDYIFDGEYILLGEDGANIIERSSPLAFRVSGKCWINNHAHVLEPKKNQDINFLTYYLENLKYDKLNSGTAQPKLNQETCRKIKIICPSKMEQQKLASILSTQDKIIDLKERLLEEKKQQKKYLMQQLLTGKKRLPGFSEEWENFGFNDVFCTLPTNTLSREDMCKSGGIIRNIHYGDVLIHYGEVLNINEEDVPYIIEGKEPAHYMQVENGDVIIADTAEDMTVGKTTEIQNIKTDKVVSGLHTICCRPIKKYFCEGWLGYYMNSEEYHGQIKRLACGSKVFSISKTEIKKTRLRIPCINEQKEIIDILSTKNREIALSEQSIKAEKQKKKALMQLLLTGIVRVKI